jgi:hypothetical protein
VRVVVQTDRAFLEDLIAQIKDAAKRKAAENRRLEIERTIGKLDKLGARGKVGAPVDPVEMKNLEDDLDTQLLNVAKILANAGVLDADVVKDLPRPTYSFNFSGGRAEGAYVDDLSANRPMGSPPYQNPLVPCNNYSFG